MNEFKEALVDLASIDAYPTPSMSEKDFTRILLPLIVNIDNVPNIDMSIWLTIAGNAHRSINVFDASNTLIFTVPPLLARVPTNAPSLTRDGQDISSIVHHYGALRLVEHPATADVWFAAAMQDSIISVDEETHIKNLKTWIDIYVRYNIPLDRLLPNGSVTLPDSLANKPTVAESVDETTGEFDDF